MLLDPPIKERIKHVALIPSKETNEKRRIAYLEVRDGRSMQKSISINAKADTLSLYITYPSLHPKVSFSDVF